MNAGEYSNRLQLLQCTRTLDTATGDKPKTYTAAGYLWAAVDLESASVQSEYGAPRSQSTGTIRLRNYPTVTTSDRLYLAEWEQTYIIDGIRWGDNETICDVHTLEIE